MKKPGTAVLSLGGGHNTKTIPGWWTLARSAVRLAKRQKFPKNFFSAIFGVQKFPVTPKKGSFSNFLRQNGSDFLQMVQN